jgi:hypothetical protein
MKLRSGIFVRSGLSITAIKYREFRIECRNFIGELNDSACHVNTVHILYRMYSYIDRDIDNVGSYLDLYTGLKSFLLGVANSIPQNIIDIISCERNHDMGRTWVELTGYSAIEIGRMMYELRFKIRAIVDAFNNTNL